jgi:uncharacterized protein (TIGR02001 family)
VKKQTMAAIALSTAALMPAHAVDVSANGGWSSEYIFRGVPQSDSSAFGGVDIEESGFFGGIWAADVTQGLEYDLYGGYSGEYEDFTYSAGVTLYLYTDDFDDDYRELNLSGGYGPFTLDVALGEYDNFSGPTQDYTFVSITGEYQGFYGTFGTFSNDFDGEYIEAGYGNTFTIQDTELFDYSLAIIYSSDDLLNDGDPTTDDEDTSLVLTVTKSFGLLSQ